MKRIFSLLVTGALVALSVLTPAADAHALSFVWGTTTFTLTAGEQLDTRRLVDTGIITGNQRPRAEATMSHAIPGLSVWPRAGCVPLGGGREQCTGIAELRGAPTTPGTYRSEVTMRFGDWTDTREIVITVLGGTPAAARSTITSSTGDRLADGVDAHDVTVAVRSSAGIALAGMSSAQVVSALGVEARGARLGTFVEQPAGNDDEVGRYRAPVTSTTAGTASVTADAAGSPRALVFTSTYSADRSTLAVTSGARRADGADTHTVTLDLRSGSGAALTGLTDAQVRSDSGVAVAGAVLGAFREGAAGRYQAAVTATVPGVHRVTASATGSPATLTFVTPVVARPDTADVATGARGVQLRVLGNDAGDAVRVRSATLAPAAAGTVRAASDSGHLVLDAAEGFAGRATIRYEVVDAHGFTAASTVAVSVFAAPQVRDATARVGVGRTVEVDASALVVASQAPAQGDGTFPGLRRPAAVVAATADHGTASVAAGVLTHRAPAGFIGTARVALTARDDLQQTGSGEVVVTVVAAPVLNDVTREVRYGTDLVVTPADLGVTPGLTRVSADAGSGDVTFEALPDGTYRYHAQPGHVGLSTFVVTYADDLDQRATATIRITAVRPPVVAVDDTTDLAEGAVGATVHVLENDGGDDLRVLAVRDIDPAHGSARLAPDGSALLFTPAEGFVGRTTLRYDVGDGTGRDTGVVTVTVFAAPALVDAGRRVGVDGSVDVDLGPLVVASVVPPQGVGPLPGLRRPASVTAVRAVHGTAVLTGGVLTYSAPSGFVGTDTVVLTATDDLGQSGTGEVTVEVVAPPTLRDITLQVPYDTDTVITREDLGAAAGLDLVSVDERTGDVTFEHRPDRTFRHHAVARYLGSDAFTVTFADDLGQRATATVSVVVVAPPLVAADHAADVPSDVVDRRFDVLTGAAGDEPQVVAAGVREGHGGSARPSEDGGQVIFSAAAGFVGSTVVDYTIEDVTGQQDAATVTVHVYAPPLVRELSRRLAAGGSTQIEVDRLLADPVPAPVARLALPGLRRPAQVVDAQARTGSVDLVDGVLTYRAAPGFVGTDTVRLIALDDLDQTGSGEVTLVVVAPPVLRDVLLDVEAGTTSVVTPQDLGVSSDLTLVSVDAGTGPATFAVRDDGAFDHHAPVGHVGTDTFAVVYTDDLGQVARATVTGTVRAPGDGGAAATLALTGALTASVALLALGLGLGGRVLVGLSRLRRPHPGDREPTTPTPAL